ncbi:MAG: hypothetical protein U5P10_10795 [Spirochaetia bacterium]|nr:hypothetical protein [Spirochaetia bacterium]
MKRSIMLCTVFLLAAATVFAGGEQETEEKMIIRVAEQVPNLITPGVWDGQAFSLNGSIYDYLIEMDANTGESGPPWLQNGTAPMVRSGPSNFGKE